MSEEDAVYAEAYNKTMGREVMDVPEFEEEPPEEIPEETPPEEVPEETPEETPEGEAPEETPEETPEGEDPEETSEETPEETPEEPKTKTIEELIEENNRLREQSLAWAGRVSAADKRLNELAKKEKPEVSNILADDGTLGEGFKELAQEYPELNAVEQVLQAQQQQIAGYNGELSTLAEELAVVKKRQEIGACVEEVNKQYPGYQDKINNESFVRYVQETVNPELIPTLVETTDPELLKTVVGGFFESQRPKVPNTVPPEDTDRKQKQNDAALHASLGVSTRATAVVATDRKEESADDLFDQAYKRAKNY